MRPSTFLALAAAISASAAGSLQGFNYGSTKSDGSFQFQSDFEALFAAAKKVTSGFNSARLYTMIQGGSSTNEPISAIPAAIAQDTTLLLGLWASGGEAGMQAEITALKSAIEKYGSKFADLVVGISVGSEDLYRISPTGIAAESGYGANPDELVNYIKQVRDAIADTPLSKATIGHVDTWTAWANSSNSAVADACDWVGMDAYPYFQNSMPNSIEAGAGLFNDALEATKAAVGGKEVWITETGWPVSGKTENLAVPNTKNAKAYWDAVGCPNFGKMNMYWFTLQDSAPVTPNPSFGIVGNTLSNTPLYDLSCDNISALPSTTAPTASGSGPAKETGSGTNLSSTIISSPGHNSLSNTSPTSTSLSNISSPSASSGSGSGSGTGSAGPSGPIYGVPGSPANSSTIGSPTGGAPGGNVSSASGTGAGTGTGTGTGTGSTPAPTTNAAIAMFVSGPAVGFLAAAAAVVAVL